MFDGLTGKGIASAVMLGSMREYLLGEQAKRKPAKPRIIWKKKYPTSANAHDNKSDAISRVQMPDGSGGAKVLFNRVNNAIAYKDAVLQIEAGTEVTREIIYQALMDKRSGWDFTFHNHKRKKPYIVIRGTDSDASYGVARIPVEYLRPRDEFPREREKYPHLIGRSIIGVFFADGEGEYQEDPQFAEKMALVFEDGTYVVFYHGQDCCESVSIADITGDVSDLVGVPLLNAEKATNYCDDYRVSGDEQWTFYRFQTSKGEVVVRWFGESNGYYGIEVDEEYGKLSNLKEAFKKEYVSHIHKELFGPDCAYLVDEAAMERAKLESIERNLQERVDKAKKCIETKGVFVEGVGHIIDFESAWWVMDELCIASTETQSAEWFKELFNAEERMGPEYVLTQEKIDAFNTVVLAAFLVKKDLK